MVVVAGGTALTFAQEAKSRPPAGNSTAQSSSDPNLTLSAGDLLELVVYGVPELTLKTRVSEQDTVNLPLVGEMNVQGRTLKQFQDELAQKLVADDMVLHPQISVLVTEYATEGISVLGEVNQPGIYPLLGPQHLFDGIAAAGGLSSKAARTVKVVHKRAPDDPMVVELPMDLSSSASSAANIAIFPGDTIVVAKAGVVYVVGEVNKAGGFLMENNTRLTVLQAVALAQGITKFANLKKTQIVRRNSQGVQQITIGLDRILKGREPDHMLDADDILFIPTSGPKSFNKRLGDGAVAAAAAAAIYASHY